MKIRKNYLLFTKPIRSFAYGKRGPSLMTLRRSSSRKLALGIPDLFFAEKWPIFLRANLAFREKPDIASRSFER